jgi:hypothetical protein
VGIEPDEMFFQGDLNMKGLKLFNHFGARLLLTSVFLLSFVAGFTGPVAAAPENSAGTLYTLSNAASGNEVLAYDRSADGSLSFQRSYSTGGLGSGAGLGSQSSVILSKNHQWLFAVNAGSNEISVFGECKWSGIGQCSQFGRSLACQRRFIHWLYVPC